MGKNITALGATLHSRINTNIKANKITAAELGTIGAAKELQPDRSPGPIPHGEYSICRHISGEKMTEITHMGDTMVIQYPELEPGDRVVLINDGTESVVIDVIR